MVGGLDFVLRSNQSDTAAWNRTIKEKPVPAQEQKSIPVQEQKTIPLVSTQPSGKILINADSSRFHIQVGAFRVQANALAAQTKLSAFLGRPAVIILENGFYKLRITGFTSFGTATNFLQKVFRDGFPDAFIHKNK
jgi:cell division protein FtsN